MTPPQVPTAEQSLALVHHSLSRQGDRDYNEDAYCHVRDGDIVSFAVAVGMGGAAGGMQASGIAMATIRKNRLTLDPTEFAHQLDALSEEIKAEQVQKPNLSKMSTTVAELRIDTYTQKAIWAHWGDTRVYWFRDGELKEMTEDHSVVQSLVAAGLISEDEAATYPKRNVLLGAAGTTSEVGPTVLERAVTLANDDAFLLCSDGVWSVVNTAFMEASLKRSASVQDWINAIMDEVDRAGKGSNDNFTATGIWVSADNEKTLSPGL